MGGNGTDKPTGGDVKGLCVADGVVGWGGQGWGRMKGLLSMRSWVSSGEVVIYFFSKKFGFSPGEN